MIRVELTRIIIDEKRQDQIIVLKEKEGARQFPIVIGLVEASSIKMRLSGITMPRPLTHDLLYSIIKELEAKLDLVLIDKLEANTFFAKLFLKTADGRTLTVDARPSDSIALAVRADAPIFVEEQVLQKATILKIE